MLRGGRERGREGGRERGAWRLDRTGYDVGFWWGGEKKKKKKEKAKLS